MKTPIYMDHNATTPVDPRVVEAMAPCWCEHFGNAASRTHAYGWTTGPLEGVEIVLMWARPGPEQPYVPVAASATVVVETGQLPPELAFWHRLGMGAEDAPTGEP